MKKWGILYIIAAFILLLGASPWEGEASIAPQGELPSNGFFIASNSYPVNTLVDITNLDTNKTTRVIVAKTLDSPNLIAIVSRQAAEIIGMRSGIISRIRMVQVSEPIAYSRFTEGFPPDISGYSEAEEITDETYSENVYVPPVSVMGEKIESVLNNFKGPSYTLEPEWQNNEKIDLKMAQENSVNETIQNTAQEKPQYIAGQEPVNKPAPEEKPQSESFYFEETLESIKEKIQELVKDTTLPEQKSEVASETAHEETLESIKEKIQELVKDTTSPEQKSEVASETAHEETLETIKEKIQELITDTTPTTEQNQFNLIPAEERPPEQNIYGIDPDDIFPGVINIDPGKEPEIPPSHITPIAPDNSGSPEITFSATRVKELAHGYYVQLAAFKSPELIENVLKKIDRNYGPVVFKDGDDFYRVLLGPFNQGESAAVLQRFKSIGFSDAFVRYVR